MDRERLRRASLSARFLPAHFLCVFFFSRLRSGGKNTSAIKTKVCREEPSLGVGLYYKRCRRRVFPPLEDLETSRGKVCREPGSKTYQC